MIVIDQVVVGVQLLVGLRLPSGPAFGQVLRHPVSQATKAKLLHVRQGGVASVVEHDVEQHADAAGMCLLDQLSQVGFGAHVGVQLGVIQCVIAVVGVMAKVAFIAATDPAVNLFIGCTDPQRVHAQLGQVIELAGQPFEIAAMKGADFLSAVGLTAIAAVVVRVAIGETVGQGEIDGRVAPVSRPFRARLGSFDQQ